ncbi:MAG: hypothetical protein HKP58_06165, partial [Desulfatitalea sp.]|nr:hypothetical protein [Desulfatitalea sp.]NNJ99981.1 hypothetical protein [Desulfatitalea sp.]
MSRLYLAWVIVLLVAGCATGPHQAKDPVQIHHQLQDKVKTGSDELARLQARMRSELQQKGMQKIEIEPVLPQYDPLEDHTVSFSMVDEPIQSLLYAMAKAVGMNIILDPAVKDETRRMTLHFEKVSAARVLREILG